MKNLVICPKCNSNGTKSVLGEIGSTGSFLVLRFHQAYTEIIGNDFGVKCGNCGEKVYIRKEEHGTNSNQWVQRVHWKQTVQSFGTATPIR